LLQVVLVAVVLVRQMLLRQLRVKLVLVVAEAAVNHHQMLLVKAVQVVLVL
jgi:hypothetical protein